MLLPIQTLIIVVLSLMVLACSSEDNSEPPAALTKITKAISLRVDWSTDTDAVVSGASFDMRPLIIGDQVLSIDIAGVVKSVNPESGHLNWRFETGVAAMTGLAGGQDVIVATSGDGDLAAFKLLDNGLEKSWEIQLQGEIRAIPTLHRDLLFVRTVAGKLSAVTLADGTVRWTVSRRIPALSLTGNSSPLVFKDMVIVGFDDGKIAAFDHRNGQTVWEAVVSHSVGRSEIERLVDIDGQFILKDGIIYVSTYQGKLAAIQAHNGNVLWSRKFSSYQAIVADEDALYISGELSHLWSIDRRSGSAFWKQDVLHARKTTPPQIIDDHIVVADFEGYVHWFDKSDGSLAGRIRPSNSGHISQPLQWRDNVLVFDSRGQLSSLTQP
ncbi:MAG: outer membrane protein assembly factor BamB [Gammaproteobacteria bacterium]|nr:outer membrane protein assembly factor BamB [Gammaproteobacteria bacterium]